MVMTYIENLSNEIFYEIFDYLDGCDIYKAFSNLNHHFKKFLQCSSLRFKIKLNSSSSKIFMNYSKQIRLMNKHQILSFDLRSGLYIDEFLSTFFINSSFDYLESITLHFMEEYFLLSLLHHFIYLPRLLSLNVHADETLTDLSDVYRLGFALPILKYFKIKSEDWIESWPFATTNQQFSTVKYLVIDHYCTFDHLATILSYTPELCHLCFEHQSDHDSNVEIILPITLSNLIRISLKIIRSDYNEVIKFLKKISSKLKFLRLTIQSDDVIYLVYHLWERLILQYFPNLEKFYLKHFESIDYDNRSRNYLWQGNQFTSSFWIERQWIFHAEIYTDEIIYSIYPYKITWYDSAESEMNSMHSIEQKPICTSSILTINNRHFSGYLQLLYENIIWMTTVTTIYHLQFCQRRIPIHTLIKIINFLSNLDSLKVWSLSLLKSKRLSWKKIQFIDNVIKKNKITKVYLENMIKIEESFVLIDLFPRMKYLQIGWKNNIDITSFVRIILMKILNKSNHELRSLCFCPSMADNNMVKKLQNMIDFDKLIFDYKIKRICDLIYLKWK